MRRDAPGFGGTRYFMIQNGFRATPRRAALIRDGDEWRTFFSSDRRVRRDGYLRAQSAAPGDGHATLESQHDLSPQETGALAAAPFLLRGDHFGMILDPAAQRRLLEFLHEP